MKRTFHLLLTAVFAVLIITKVTFAKEYMDRVTMIRSEGELIEAIPMVEVKANEDGVRLCFDREIYTDMTIRIGYYAENKDESPELMMCNVEEGEEYEISIPGFWHPERPYLIELTYKINWGIDYKKSTVTAFKEQTMLPKGGYSELVQTILVKDGNIEEEFMLSAPDDLFGFLKLGFARDRVHWHSVRYQLRDEIYGFIVEENDYDSVKEVIVYSNDSTTTLRGKDSDYYEIALCHGIAGTHPLRFAEEEADREYPIVRVQKDGHIGLVKLLPETTYWDDHNDIENEVALLEKDGLFWKEEIIVDNIIEVVS